MATHPEAGASVLSESQLGLIADVLDRIVPRNGKLPGAGELGVAEHIDSSFDGSPDLRRLLSDGLAAIEAASQSEFSSLSGKEKTGVLQRVESEHPEFFEALVRHTYAGYYVNPTVIGLLGLDERPPQPRGYSLEPLDPGMLENVKKRGKIYRDT